MISRYGLVSGIVQGVGFRAYVERIAQRAGLSGFARNLPDGRVEVLLCGDPEQVANAEKEVAIGPPTARVTEVRWEDRDDPPLENFERG
ncbi:acylphosphatase [Gilvimarinus sp. F26214L]|uniref:acylphosphatase n=1 Tax=Gilvimarinus sp. DZF01 TaxID=3461371 RepID=UPI0040466A5E